ncbi:MAG: hypothetical protein U0234_03290 [Sandaracinus sp.]
MRRSVPSLDQVARALLVHGAREAAIDLMEAVVQRGGDEKTRCEALLAAVRARPNDRVIGAPIALDAGLVEALAAQGRLIEAWAVTRGAKVGSTVAGVEIAQALSLVMEPSGLEEPWLQRWTTIVASGSLAEIAAIEREVVRGDDVPAVLLDRMRVAWRLLRGFWSSTASEGVSGIDPALRASIAKKVTAHDLPGALALLRGAAETSPTVLPIAMALARLLSAAERVLAEEAPGSSSTVPLGGPAMALFQLRMGNFEDAEKQLRRIVVEQPNDHVARDRLADVLVLRRALDDAPVAEQEPLELAKTPAPDWLNKKGPRVSVEGWAAPPKAGAAKQGPVWDDEEEGSTSVIRPDEEAELHVKSGHPERAIPIYELLVQRYPGRPRFATRLNELRVMVAAEAATAPTPAAPLSRSDYHPAFEEDGAHTSVERFRQAPPARAPKAPGPAAAAPPKPPAPAASAQPARDPITAVPSAPAAPAASTHDRVPSVVVQVRPIVRVS